MTMSTMPPIWRELGEEVDERAAGERRRDAEEREDRSQTPPRAAALPSASHRDGRVAGSPPATATAVELGEIGRDQRQDARREEADEAGRDGHGEREIRPDESPRTGRPAAPGRSQGEEGAAVIGGTGSSASSRKRRSRTAEVAMRQPSVADLDHRDLRPVSLLPGRVGRDVAHDDRRRGDPSRLARSEEGRNIRASRHTARSRASSTGRWWGGAVMAAHSRREGRRGL